jgi:hypothetical protein
VIFCPIMMMYNENNVHKRGEFKDELVNILHLAFDMTLIYTHDNLILS